MLGGADRYWKTLGGTGGNYWTALDGAGREVLGVPPALNHVPRRRPLAHALSMRPLTHLSIFHSNACW